MTEKVRKQRIAISLLVAAAAVWLVPLRAEQEGESPIYWFKDMDRAIEAATKENKPMMVEFWADWCAACKVMEKEIYPDPKLSAAIREKLVAVRINYDLQQELVHKYNVPALPYIVFTNSYGTELLHQRGIIEAPDLTAVVNALPADVSELNRLDRGLQEDKNNVQNLVAMGREMRRSGFYESSSNYYNRALKQDAIKKDAAQREAILYDIGLNALELQDGKQAISVFERCLKEFPKSARRPDFLLGVSKAYAIEDKKDKAQKSLDALFEGFPDSPAAAE